MTLKPLTESGPIIIVHTVAAVGAIALGALQFIGPKGTISHRAVGYAWVAMMMTIALTSFFIHRMQLIGIWSPIHLLSILILFTVPIAVYKARTHDVSRHRRSMIQIYALALIVTGAFTLLPGRVLHRVFFGG